MLIVQKFGGSSVADPAGLARAARLTAEAYREGKQIVTVVSAQGDTTDLLTEKAAALTAVPDPRELDALLATGEQASAALLAMALENLGIPAVSLSGAQLGIHTDSHHGDALIRNIDTTRLRQELEAGKAVVAAGFQGTDDRGDLNTLGRGGSDTTAAALAAALKADHCIIYTDVDGVYTADPRRVPEARLLESVSWQEMLALASLGSQVLHDRCVALAMKHGVELIVRASAASSGKGTRVGRAPVRRFTGVTRSGNTVGLVGGGLADTPDAAARLRAALSQRDIPCGDILPSRDGLALTVTVAPEAAEEALRAVHTAFFTDA